MRELFVPIYLRIKDLLRDVHGPIRNSAGVKYLVAVFVPSQPVKR